MTVERKSVGDHHLVLRQERVAQQEADVRMAQLAQEGDLLLEVGNRLALHRRRRVVAPKGISH